MSRFFLQALTSQVLTSFLIFSLVGFLPGTVLSQSTTFNPDTSDTTTLETSSEASGVCVGTSSFVPVFFTNTTGANVTLLRPILASPDGTFVKASRNEILANGGIGWGTLCKNGTVLPDNNRCYYPLMFTPISTIESTAKLIIFDSTGGAILDEVEATRVGIDASTGDCE